METIWGIQGRIYYIKKLSSYSLFFKKFKMYGTMKCMLKNRERPNILKHFGIGMIQI